MGILIAKIASVELSKTKTDPRVPSIINSSKGKSPKGACQSSFGESGARKAVANTYLLSDKYNLDMARMIETERLLLRNWRDTDRETWIHMNQDPEVMRFFPKHLTGEEPTSMQERVQRFLDEHEYGLWAVEIKKGDPFIGFVGLSNQSLELSFMPCVEIGWRLHKRGWGKGYATEAATEVLSFGLQELHLPEIFSFTSKLNVPPIKVMRRIGLHRRRELDFLHPRIEEGNPLRGHLVYSSSPTG